MLAANLRCVPSLGGAVRQRREELQWSQDALSERSTVAQSIISKIETGETPDPGVRQFALIATALGRSVEDLLAADSIYSSRLIEVRKKTARGRDFEPAMQPAASAEEAPRSKPSLEEQWVAFRADLRPALLKLAEVLEQDSPEARALRRALGEP